MRTTIFFDGGCRPNPGPMEAAVVCRGLVTFHDNLGLGDSGEAEWLAALLALDTAAALGATDVLLIGDAAAVIRQASGRDRGRSARLRRHLDRFREQATGFSRVHLRHCKRSANLAGIALAARVRSGAVEV